MKKITLLTLFAGTIYAANLALETWGHISLPPFGWDAPAGVLFAGLAFGLRDALHEAGGRRWVLGGIGVGALFSYALSDGVTIPGGIASIAVASAIAFLLSELADLAVYEPLRQRNLVDFDLCWAIDLVDSLLFLWLAFGAFDAIGGQVYGKMLMVVPAIPIVYYARRRS